MTEPKWRKALSISERIRHLEAEIQYVISAYRPLNAIFIEGAGLWGDDARSIQAAKRGDTFLLAYLVGALLTSRPIPTLITPQQWKGSLTAEQVEERIKRHFGLHKVVYKEHVREAVGMGLALMGVL